jgi:hypothetical protein
MRNPEEQAFDWRSEPEGHRMTTYGYTLQVNTTLLQGQFQK